MKTAVRITTTEPDKHSNYAHYNISLLKESYPGEGIETREWYATLKFQKDPTNDYWYGFELECRSEKTEDFILCAKILKHIHTYKENHSPQPEEILNIIGAVKYVRYKGWGNIPESYNGYKIFRVMNGSDYYSSIFAPTEALALKKLEKNKRYKGMSLEFAETIKF